ncbi:hypothetical protein Syn7502_02249 [Synechococcus sp. PCC 7502]|uniref:DUF3084 domain-containing protein n=1 Tax=Synechococcus sp. PCC 7502 TaxID=1173263 RepID=UPI00029FB4F8|nr:DUF3084 domain-containing protein [Synechococcus sp. PCC 7502]AFY74257.1 hypothetical protein Syn7502_02249 [Synechococcus sp. PCC 7502]
MAGYVLVLAILILGGLIATLGDRIGTKVGKARLSIFNLRPRNTATLITIATGGMIAASTLGVLLASSSQLQDGLFRLDSIRSELKTAQAEKEKMEAALAITRRQRDQEKRNLEQINNSLAEALFRQSRTQAQLQSVQQKFQSAKQELEKVQAQEQELLSKIQDLNDRQKSLLADSQKLLNERNQLNTDLAKISSDRQVLRNRVAESQTKLSDLEKQRTALSSELKTLEKNRELLNASIQALRRGNVAIQSEQVLTAAVINGGLSSQDLRLAVFQVLQQADQNARTLLDFPAESRPVIQVSETQIDNLLQKLADGKSYILRVLSAGNYLRKESSVSILADITPNKEVFKPGELIASLTFKANMSESELEGQLDKLFLLVSFRARQQGVLPNPFTGKVGNFPQSALFDLSREFKQYKSAIEIQAIAKETIFTGSPLTLTLVVLENGVEIRRFG